MQKRSTEVCEGWTPHAQSKTAQGLPESNCYGVKNEREIQAVLMDVGSPAQPQWKDFINTLSALFRGT